MSVANKATGRPGVEIYPAPVYYISRVKSKLASGEYQTEEVPCFCGSTVDEAIIVTHRDRYGLPHQMNLCKKCGLLYASPRMTEESYRKFYDNEYVHLYSGWDSRLSNENGLVQSEKVFASTLSKGGSFYQFIEHFDIPTDIVFEIGCNMGSWLLPFRANGSEVYGVDYGSTNVEFGKTKGINVMEGGIEDLVKLGKKADLIIMNQVFEHLLDLRGELNKVRKLLKPKGLLYIAVPGMFTTDLNVMFQNAHTYQFSSDTLQTVMHTCGFEDYYCDEQVNSLWQMVPNQYHWKDGMYVGENWEVGERSELWDDSRVDYGGIVRDIWELFFGDPKKRRAPQIKTINKFTHKERKKNIQDILSFGFPDISVLINAEAGKEAIVIAGGPSIDNYVEKIRELQKEGKVIVAIERMYTWLAKHNIVPDYVVVLDASEDVKEALHNPLKKAKHLISTQCRVKTAEQLKDVDSYVFSIPQHGVEQQNYWLEGKYDRITVINGGGSVSLQAMAISMLLGMKDLHIFGMDLHLEGGLYADGIAGVGDISNEVSVKIDDEVVRTTISYLSFAQQFFLMMYTIAASVTNKITIYGDSLIKRMAEGNEYDE